MTARSSNRPMRSRYQVRHPFGGLIAGAISGLAGTIIMTQFRNVWNMIFEEHKTETDQEARTAEQRKKEDSTMKAAGKLSEEIGWPLSRAERRKAGPSFGTSVSAVFGLATEAKPKSLRGVNPVLVGGRLRRCCFPGCARTCSSSVETIFESSQGTRAGPNRRIYLALDLWHRHGVDVRRYQKP